MELLALDTSHNSQPKGAGRAMWPLVASGARILIAAGGVMARRRPTRPWYDRSGGFRGRVAGCLWRRLCACLGIVSPLAEGRASHWRSVAATITTCPTNRFAPRTGQRNREVCLFQTSFGNRLRGNSRALRPYVKKGCPIIRKPSSPRPLANTTPFAEFARRHVARGLRSTKDNYPHHWRRP